MANEQAGFGPGLYEAPITHSIAEAIESIEPALISRRGLSPVETPDRVALHLRREIERALESIPETERVSVAVKLIDLVLTALTQATGDKTLRDQAFAVPAEVLSYVTSYLPDGTPKPIRTPLISLLDTTLLTNANREPRVGSQLLAEIDSASQIDILVAFVRRSGIRSMIPSLQQHCEAGGKLRVLTTTYTGSTERQALEDLVKLGAEVRVSYDTSSTRLHAKAWLFKRPFGYSTAYIGSSNLTNMALHDGLEWNLRVSGARNPDVVNKVDAVFESYWQGGNFVDFNPDEFHEQMRSTQVQESAGFLSPIQVTPQPFQSRLLELIQLERDRGRHRNLIVAATGTGKTVMAALDYRRLASVLPRTRLLFVAHREEILQQSQATFRQVLQDPSFGELWVGGTRPQRFDYVFASVQTLARVDLSMLPSDHFDVVIMDEFHHAAAASYDKILSHLTPIELLGLTATPERADGASILHWFDDRIAAELRLWDAIDQQFLSPFAYYGIHDGSDLREVPWHPGTGYDVDALTNVLTANDVWARTVVNEFFARVGDVSTVRALGFCVSIAHAHFMAEKFTQYGLPAVAVTGKTPEDERRKALHDLRSGSLRAIFSVDVFNEGVDVPTVDAILMLRPTQSATVFLQQLGRGLRKADYKKECVVLDFVGMHRKEFRFDLKYRALLGGTRSSLSTQIQSGFPFLPAGCHMELDAVAQRVVLESLRSALPSTFPQRVRELEAMLASGSLVTLPEYLENSGLEIEDIYSNHRCWSDFLEAAGVSAFPAGPEESKLRRSVGRLLHVNDGVRLRSWVQALRGDCPQENSLDVWEVRMLRMLIAQVVSSSGLDRAATLQQGIDLLWRHPQVVWELIELFEFLLTRIDHLHTSLEDRPEIPLVVHGRYSRPEILAAFGSGHGAMTPEWREGVRWLPEASADLLAFTLDKSDGGFSATTSYRDYAVSSQLIHWESQNATRSSSPTGIRYVNHRQLASDVYLFARSTSNDRSFWFLGPARYVSHSGERPMGITWELEVPLPGDLFAEFAAAVA